MIQVENATTYRGPGEYIGRGMGKWKASPLGNPKRIGVHGDRESCIRQYKVRLLLKLLDSKSAERIEFERLLKIYRQIGELVLICWCVPENCHGNVLANLLDFARFTPDWSERIS